MFQCVVKKDLRVHSKNLRRVDINKAASGVYSVAASPQLFLSLMTRVVRVFVAGRCCAYRATECASRTIVTGQERESEERERVDW